MAGLLVKSPARIFSNPDRHRPRAKNLKRREIATTENRPASRRTDTPAMENQKVGKQPTHDAIPLDGFVNLGPARIVNLKIGKIKHSGNLFGQRGGVSLGKDWRTKSWPKPPRSQAACRSNPLFVCFCFGFGHDFLLNIRRHNVVMRKLHRVTALPARHAGQSAGVGRYFRQGNLGTHRLQITAR